MNFLRGIVDFWRIAVFRKELLAHNFDGKPYCAGYLTGCLLMFIATGGVAYGLGYLSMWVII